MKSFIGNVKAWLTFAPTSRPRKMLKQYLIRVKTYINTHPRLKKKLLHILDTMPSLKTRLQRIGEHSHKNHPHEVRLTLETLSPNAKEIYNKLQQKMHIYKNEK